MKKSLITAIALGLAGCAGPVTKRDTYDQISAEMAKAAAVRPAAPEVPKTVSDALLPPLQAMTQKPVGVREEHFSVAFNNVPAAQFFMGIASGTRYNMLVHPDVKGNISANLKDVTMHEALSAIRELYGYDFEMDGTRIVIKPLTLQTRIFHVNYLTGQRRGVSETRVSAGIGNVSGNNPGNAATGVDPTQQNQLNQGGGNAVRVAESSRVSSSSSSDFWGELRDSLRALVGIDETPVPGAAKDNRSVVISPQSGVIVVRAMPEELRAVSQYLKLAQLSVERQVILEAKILEVQLNDSFQAGVNWASFASFMGIRNNRTTAGFISPGTTLASAAQSNDLTTSLTTTNPVTGNTGATAVAAATSLALTAAGNAAGSLFSFAFQTNNFATLLTFLETQGTVHVLSSPRIATLNNQKAILKVGTDDFFVTRVSSNTTERANGTTSSTPEVTLQQFFSGVVLDVTPQIDEQDNITLHVHPSVTQVSTQNKQVSLGNLGTLNLPLASSNTSETDSVVRGRDGQIIAIGGLMRQATTNEKSQVPGAGDVPVVGGLFRNTSQVTQKRELVILLKPTIVQDGASWNNDVIQTQQRIQNLDPGLPAKRR